MVKEIVKDTELLQKRSVKAIDTPATRQLIIDLLDTARSLPNCIGLAANQIGEPIKICVVKVGGDFIPIINPVIESGSAKKVTLEETCLSVDHATVTTRPVGIRIIYQKKLHSKYVGETFTGVAARVIMHSIDHFNGILI